MSGLVGNNGLWWFSRGIVEYGRFNGEFWTVVVQWVMADWEWPGRK
jgi:hypothetical protein